MPEFPDYLRSPTCWSLFFTSLFATAALTPLVIRLARRVGAVDSGGHRRIYRGSMPLLGGLGIIIPFVGVCFMGLFSITGMFGYIESMKPQFLVLALGSVAICAVGIYDDTRGLRIRYKLLAQTVIALFVVATGEVLDTIYLPLVGEMQIGAEVGVLLGVAWIVGLINAMNLIDGIDGLATGIALIAAVGLAALGAIGQYTFVVLLTVSLAGSLLGFLPYNFYPAKVFLGDTGSMFAGFALATITLMGTYRSETAVIVAAPLLALGFPIFETVVSIARRLIRGAPIFASDDRHTHHRLLDQGYSQRRVVLLLWGVSGVLASVAIMSRLLPKGSRWEWISLVVVGATLTGIGWLAGYLRSVPVERVFQRRQRNATLHAFARYAALSLSARFDVARAEEVLGLARMELDLRYLSVRLEDPDLELTAAGSHPGAGPKEALRVRAPNGGGISIEYEFERSPDQEERRDVATCLAQLFEQSSVGANHHRAPR